MKRWVSMGLIFIMLIAALPAMAIVIRDPSLPDPDKYQYTAVTTVKFNLRETADEKSRRIREVSKGTWLNVIEYGDEWCYVELKNKVGYAKTKWLFRFKSTDPHRYPIPGFDMPYGIGEMKTSFNTKGLAGNTGRYSGNQFDPGQRFTVHTYDEQRDVATILVWKSYVEMPAGSVKVTPFVPYDQAQPGDLIGGYTTYQSGTYGFPKHKVRQYNIARSIELLTGAIVQPGELFSFNSYAGPYSAKTGYKIAYILGDSGVGYGGGVCQISILTRSGILGLPMLIKDWYMHTEEGTVYTTQICDATVGNSRDFTFYNVLDYPILMDYNHDGDPNIMNLFIYRAAE